MTLIIPPTTIPQPAVQYTFGSWFTQPEPPPFARIVYCFGGGCEGNQGLVLSPNYVFYIDIYPPAPPPITVPPICTGDVIVSPCLPPIDPPCGQHCEPPPCIDCEPPSQVPEPATILMLCLGLLTMIAVTKFIPGPAAKRRAV